MKRNIYFHDKKYLFSWKEFRKRAKSRSQKRVKESIIYHAENTEKEAFKGLEAVLKYRKRLSI